MNSIIRAASRLALRPLAERYPIVIPKAATFIYPLQKRWAHNQPLTYDFVRERVMLMLRLFDKVDPDKLTLDSHFIHDLGLDSLDQVEIIMELETEFLFEIPDKDAEKLVTPRHILDYITTHEEAYKELQDLHAHHGHHDHGGHHSDDHRPSTHGDASNNHGAPSITQKRDFSSWVPRRYMTNKSPTYPTSFRAKPPNPPSFEEIQARVMKICSKYDKIDSSKLDVVSHFVQDLGLDSLDHVEIMMELEDEFDLEIPDQDAEKLMRPVEIARYVMQKEEARALQSEDRPF